MILGKNANDLEESIILQHEGLVLRRIKICRHHHLQQRSFIFHIITVIFQRWCYLCGKYNLQWKCRWLHSRYNNTYYSSDVREFVGIYTVYILLWHTAAWMELLRLSYITDMFSWCSVRHHNKPKVKVKTVTFKKYVHTFTYERVSIMSHSRVKSGREPTINAHLLRIDTFSGILRIVSRIVNIVQT